jgi:hypothetical protein
MANLAITELEAAQHEARRAYETIAKHLLPDACRKNGCRVRPAFLICYVADGVLHWDPRDPEKRYAALMVESLAEMSPERIAQFREELAACAHDSDAPRFVPGGTIEFVLWEPHE